jgi:hypothetical protein
MYNKIWQVLLAPVDAPAAASGTTSDMSKEDIIEFMEDEGDEKEEIPLEEGDGKKKTKSKDEESESERQESDDEAEGEEDEIDELKELELETEEPTDEQLELVTPVRRKEILKKYPSLFKDFPYLEKAYYREQQFTELLPTISDAKMAVEKSQTLDNFERDIMGGNTENVLKAAKETNQAAFNKIVDNYLPTLAKVDEKAYFHVLGNVTKHTIVAMVNEARRTSNEQLQSAALLLNQFVFGTSDFQPPTNLSHEAKPEDNAREREISEREMAFVRRGFETTRGELNTRVNNTLRNTIDANIDPKQSMSEYVRRNASRDALDELDTLINKDTRFRSLVDKLWEKAFQSNFSKESTDRIRTAYVSKAKTLLPSVLKKARNEALRGTGKRVNDSSESDKRGPVKMGKPSSPSTPTGKIRNAKDIPKGMSTLEFLNSD